MDKDDLRDISKDILQELDIVSEEEYLLDITRPYHNLLQKNEKFRNIEHSQSFIWDYNTAFMEDKDITKVDITETESALILLATKEAMIVKDAAKETDEWTDKIFVGYYKALDDKGPHWRDGDATNAYRHAMWNALMTKYFLTNATTGGLSGNTKF